MKMLPGRPQFPGELAPYEGYPSIARPLEPVSMAGQPGNEGGSSIQVGKLLRKYWKLLPLFMLLGAIGGVASVVLSSPSYKARLLLEVGGLGSSFTKNGGYEYTNAENNEANMETQIVILMSDTFRQRGAQRVQQDQVALPPAGRDIFSKLRQRINPAAQDPIESANRALNVAVASFSAKPVAKTRLIELTCDSTSPEIAAQFLNAMAAEFQDDNSRMRLETSQKAGEWLAGSIEDTKTKMQAAEERLREFAQASGFLFTGQNQDDTLNDTKLLHLKGELARIQTDRIARQTRYEEMLKTDNDSLAEVLGDATLLGYKQQIEALKRDKAALETRFTPKHEKVRELDARLTVLENGYQNEINSMKSRTKSDYESVLQQERMLSTSYTQQTQRVGAEEAKTAQYNALKREVDTLHQVYQSLLLQQSEAGMVGSVPINPIRLVEASKPPAFPDKPKPATNIAFGCLLGLMVTAGIAWLREMTDRSINAPGLSRQLLNARELGVIPSLGYGGRVGTPIAGSKSSMLDTDESVRALVNWQSGPSHITESFRGALASILRNQASGRPLKTILITSPGPSEGKTTIVQNLGIALAETGKRVLLVDADFRRPQLHRKFGLSNEWGILNALEEDVPVANYPTERLGLGTGFHGLSVLVNGVALGQTNISKELYSPRLRDIFETLSNHYDMVLVDAPPILAVADTRIIAPLADALILVLRCGVTDRGDATEAYNRIQEDGVTLLGTILTDYNLPSDRKREYYYDYGDARQT